MKNLTYVKTQLNVFDTYVKSLISFGAEIWKLHKAKMVEKVHIDF